MKMPQFMQPTVDAVRKGSRDAWLRGPWRVLQPLHEAGEKLADRALDACRKHIPQYYLQGTMASGMTAFAGAVLAGDQVLKMAALVYAATTVTAAALPVFAATAALAALTVAVGAMRKSARRTERYFLFERDLEALQPGTTLLPPNEAPAPLPKPAKGIFNRSADVTTGAAVTPMKALKLKHPGQTEAAP
ncbi:MAG: hypothetical protein ACAH80_01445 [Alphaproteobacteria bacterium]